MSRRARSRNKLGRVLAEALHTPPEDEPEPEDEGGIDLLAREGFDLGDPSEPPQGAQPWQP